MHWPDLRSPISWASRHLLRNDQNMNVILRQKQYTDILPHPLETPYSVESEALEESGNNHTHNAISYEHPGKTVNP